MPGLVHLLGSSSREELIAHFEGLDLRDRGLRFGHAVSTERLRAYVQGIDFSRDSVFGVRDDDGSLIAVTHLACWPGAAELGLSVHKPFRGQGLAQAMFDRAVLRARNHGIVELFMHCLAENGAMMHIARKAGMKVVVEHAESDAYLELPPADAFSFGQELVQGQLVLLDWALKARMPLLARGSGRNADSPVP